MAILTHSALFIAKVYKWQTNQPEGWNRVRDNDGTYPTGTDYLLNVNRIDGLREKYIETWQSASLYYFDNPFDNRDNSHYMEISDHTLAWIIAHMDVTPTHTHMDLEVFPDMDHTETPVTTTIPIDNFSFAVAVTDAHSATQSYVYYVDSGWKFKRCRVNQTLAQLLALVQP
jgi:hypothetical protein